MRLVEELGHRAEVELLEARTEEGLEHADDDHAKGSRDDWPPPAGRRHTNSGSDGSTDSAEDHVQDRADRRVLPEREEVEEGGRDAHEDVADVDRRREEQEETEQGPADDACQPSRDEPTCA